MPTRYMILSGDVDLHESMDPAHPSAWRPGQGGPSELQLQFVDGSEPDFARLRADPRNYAVVDAETPFALISPVASAISDTTVLQTAGMLRMPEGLLAVKAHVCPFSGQGVTVAVLDTGIDEKHPAFKGKTLAKRDFTGEGSTADDVADHHGHGTHCAGTLCGGVVDDVRVGVAPGITKLCVGKVIGARSGSLEMLVKGLLWAIVEEKASVVSMSLGYDLLGNSRRLKEKFDMDETLAYQQAMRQQSNISKTIATLRNFLETLDRNVVFVAAAGNESKRPQFVLDAGLPATELLSVGAVGMSGSATGKWEVAPFSNGQPQIVAPGVNVVSAAAGGGWVTMSGTSMATPHVAGVAALWMEKLRGEGALSVPDIVRSWLKSSVTRQPLVSTDVYDIGAGMVQAPV